MGAPLPPSGPGMGLRRKKEDEDNRPEKKKSTGKRVKGTREVEVDNELFTKGPFSGTQIIADDLGPDIVLPDEDAEKQRRSSRRDARKQGQTGSRRTLQFERPTGKVALTEGVTVK